MRSQLLASLPFAARRKRAKSDPTLLADSQQALAKLIPPSNLDTAPMGSTFPPMGFCILALRLGGKRENLRAAKTIHSNNSLRFLPLCGLRAKCSTSHRAPAASYGMLLGQALGSAVTRSMERSYPCISCMESTASGWLTSSMPLVCCSAHVAVCQHCFHTC